MQEQTFWFSDSVFVCCSINTNFLIYLRKLTKRFIGRNCVLKGQKLEHTWLLKAQKAKTQVDFEGGKGQNIYGFLGKKPIQFILQIYFYNVLSHATSSTKSNRHSCAWKVCPPPPIKHNWDMNDDDPDLLHGSRRAVVTWAVSGHDPETHNCSNFVFSYFISPRHEFLLLMSPWTSAVMSAIWSHRKQRCQVFFCPVFFN